jgi:hypothetical protein
MHAMAHEKYQESTKEETQEFERECIASELKSGVGPDCARQFQIPHSQAPAEQRLVVRRQLLALKAE